MQHPAFRLVNRFFLCVFAAIIVFIILLGMTAGPKIGISAGIGGFIALFPSWIFSWFAFRQSGARARKQIVENFYRGEGVKLFSTALLFMLVFILLKVNAAAVFIGFIAVQLLMWLIPIMFKRSW